MRLDSQYLSGNLLQCCGKCSRGSYLTSPPRQVYGSAAEASKDKSGKLALQQYRLYDLEEVALARNIHGMARHLCLGLIPLSC